jgi:DNA-binding transcriptional LysR family regulator
MDFLTLSVFVEAAGAGSLAAAARRLRIAPMAATRHLAALEKELGVRLMHRTTRSLALTNEGQTFLPHAQALLEEHDAALASMRQAASGASGLLRVTASSSFGRKVLAPAAVAFMKANPDVRVDLLLTDSVVDIVSEGLDLAVRIAKLSDTSLIARRLAPNPRGLFASPEYLRARRPPSTLADLRNHECLAIMGTTHWSFSGPDRTAAVKIDGRFTASTIEGVYQACIGGLGIALLSEWMAKEGLASGALAEVRLTDAAPEMLAIWAIYPTRRMVPAKVRLFIDALSSALNSAV